MSTTPKYTVARLTAERERRREAARLRRLAVRRAEQERRRELRQATGHLEGAVTPRSAVRTVGTRSSGGSLDDRRQAGTTRRSSALQRASGGGQDTNQDTSARALGDDVETLAEECHRVGFSPPGLDELRVRIARVAAGTTTAEAEIATLRSHAARITAQLDEWIDGQERLTEIMGALAEAFHDGGFWVADPEPGADGFVVHTTTGTSVDVAVTAAADGTCEVRYHAGGADLHTEIVDGATVNTCDGLEDLLEAVHQHAAGHGLEMDQLSWEGKPGPTARTNEEAQAPPAPRQMEAD